MANTCCVKDCFSRGGRDKVRFFRIPKVKKHHDDETKRRKKWLDNINLKNVTTENANVKGVCSKHFTDGKHYDFFSSLKESIHDSHHYGTDLGLVLDYLSLEPGQLWS